MKSTTRDMTKGSPWKLIAGFALPVLLSQIFQQLYNTADTLIVGRFLGDEALAAVSSSGPLIFLLISFFEGLTMGASVTISRYFGADDKERVQRAIHTNILVSTMSGLFLTGFGIIMTPHILGWMGTDPEVLPDAIAYFRYYFMGILSVVLYNACKSIMNALGDSRRPLYYLLLSSLTNIVLDVLFIGVFHWGVWSAAFATTISQAISMVLCIDSSCQKRGVPYPMEKSAHRPRDAGTDFAVRLCLRACRIPSSAIANVVVQSNINSFGRRSPWRAAAVIPRVEGFAFLPITCFSMSLTTFIGQNLGAQKFDRAKAGARFGILCSVVMAEIIGAAIWLLAPYCIALFNDSPEVVALGARQARTEALFYCLLAFSHCIAGICRGAGKANVPMFIMLVVWCVLRITYITIAMRISHDIQLVYFAYPLTWSISSVIYFLYYHFSNWVHGFEQVRHRDALGK